MRLISTLALVSAMGLAATPAMAQEQAPFTGPHIEALAGYDNLSGGDDGSSESKDGLLYGVGLGYDFQFGGVIAGVEGEWTDSTTKLRASDVALPGSRAQLNTDRDLYVGARVGYAISPQTMLYLKGGYTNARIETRFDNGVGGLFEDGQTLDGYRIGAGVEQQFNLFGPRGFAKLEYRYSNYSNLDIDNGDAEIADVGIDTDRHQVLVGIGVRF